jgi:hypothetical protein
MFLLFASLGAHPLRAQPMVDCSERLICVSAPNVRRTVQSQHALRAPGVTSLTNRTVKYTVSNRHAVPLARGSNRVLIVDNSASDLPELSSHKARYNGVAALTHKKGNNVFVPSYAGLNFEHIHDGTLAVNKQKFEPREWPMELRVIDKNTVELYQRPTPNWRLESCARYHLLPDGTIEYTFECIPRADVFKNGYIGLFWASYIHQPNDKSINFRGHVASTDQKVKWIQALSPQHGIDSTHPPHGLMQQPVVDPKFPLTLVNHRSKYVYDEPWYYGVSHGMALVFMFRDRDKVWFAQSPTGGGTKNPAWDFQWFIHDYKVDEAYGFVMRVAYLPFESREQVEKATQSHRQKLNQGD